MASEAYTGRPSLLRQPGSLASGALVVAGLGLAGLLAASYLKLDVVQLWPGRGGLQLAREFFSAALHPALSFEGSYAPDGRLGVLVQALKAAGMTVVFAGAAISLSLAGGAVLGFLGSSAWWDRPDRRSGWGPLITATTRLVMTFLRSIHELVWAVLLLAALGSGHLVAVAAIAIPYTGTLAKIFSEMIDEAPREADEALATAGATSFQSYLFGLVPWAMPDMLGYVFYRFECALRSSAVLGFFGFPTLGYHISASFENLHYGEVWTYLYTLFALILTVDWWSGRLRRELGS
jgi:phosphonate transport system permease protein